MVSADSRRVISAVRTRTLRPSGCGAGESFRGIRGHQPQRSAAGGLPGAAQFVDHSFEESLDDMEVDFGQRLTRRSGNLGRRAQQQLQRRADEVVAQREVSAVLKGAEFQEHRAGATPGFAQRLRQGLLGRAGKPDLGGKVQAAGKQHGQAAEKLFKSPAREFNLAGQEQLGPAHLRARRELPAVLGFIDRTEVPPSDSP